MEIVKIAILGIVGALLATELKPLKNGFGMYVAFAVAMLIFTVSMDKLSLAFDKISSLTDYLGSGKQYFSILLKVVGITYLCEFGSGICRDAGFQAIAGQIQIFGKLYVLLAGMPILVALLDTIQAIGL